MTTDVEAISPDTDVIELSQRFLSGRRGRLPVIEDGRLVGQVSRHDVLRAVKEFAQHDPGRLLSN
jgi:CBS-domain-containing membrane protein